MFPNMLWFTSLLYPPIYLAIPVLSITFDTSCFVRIVHEGNRNSTLINPDKISFPLETTALSDITISYTIQDLSHFSFAFDIEDVHMNDQISIFDGYFPFFTKHYKVCDVFILLTETFNGTATAIQQSGYGNSEDATFLVVMDVYNGFLIDHDIIKGFLSDFNSLETVSFNPIYSNLAFVALREVNTKSKTTEITPFYNFCYHCPEKFNELNASLIGNNPISLALSTIRSECRRLNNNGLNNKAFMLVPGSPNTYEGLITNINQKIGNGRKRFTQHLNDTYIAEYFLFRMAVDQINITIDPNLQQFISDDEPDIHWHLSIKRIDTVLTRFRNDIAATRGSYIVTHQNTGKLIYCMETSELVKIKWDIYLRVYDLQSWICIIGILLAYSFIYKSFSQGFDLAWIFLDMEFWRRHSRKILAPYILVAMFIHWAYDSGMSTDFIDFDFPIHFREMFDKGYRIWDIDISPGMDDLGWTKDLFPESIREIFQANTGFSDVIKAYYMEKGYYLTDNLHDCVKIIAEKKLLLLNGGANSFKFSSLLMALAAMKTVVVDDVIVCGIVHPYSDFSVQVTNSFLIRGYMSTRFVNLLESFLEVGLLKHVQDLMTLQSALKKMLRVDDVNAVLSSSTFGVRTPLGIVCASYVTLNFIFLVVFSCGVMYKHRVEIANKMKEICRLIRKRSSSIVQVFKGEDLQS
ncbi:unnamed protein product [Orchesella dallaii]|uniref:Uncharacterized protein n=1 Tax=Orchesella dallaii TaxID=48710 RepID=A0ABP1R750_9HEXA